MNFYSFVGSYVFCLIVINSAAVRCCIVNHVFKMYAALYTPVVTVLIVETIILCNQSALYLESNNL